MRITTRTGNEQHPNRIWFLKDKDGSSLCNQRDRTTSLRGGTLHYLPSDTFIGGDCIKPIETRFIYYDESYWVFTDTFRSCQLNRCSCYITTVVKVKRHQSSLHSLHMYTYDVNVDVHVDVHVDVYTHFKSESLTCCTIV